MTDLGTFGTDPFAPSAASDINPAGQVVGVSNPLDRGHAVIWDKGVITDIGANFESSGASAINPAGQVVGTIEQILNEPHATLWTRK